MSGLMCESKITKFYKTLAHGSKAEKSAISPVYGGESPYANANMDTTEYSIAFSDASCSDLFPNYGNGNTVMGSPQKHGITMHSHPGIDNRRKAIPSMKGENNKLDGDWKNVFDEGETLYGANSQTGVVRLLADKSGFYYSVITKNVEFYTAKTTGFTKKLSQALSSKYISEIHDTFIAVYNREQPSEFTYEEGIIKF